MTRTTPGLKPRIAITMGDPAGVGPEIAVKALWSDELRELCEPIVVGDMSVLSRAAQVLGRARPTPDERFVLDLHAVGDAELGWGAATAAGGRAAAAYIERAVEMALAGEVEAIVTGPLNKEALNQAEVPYPGHTEMLAALTNTRDYAMMLVGPELHVIHVSTHVSLRDAVERVRRPRIETVIRLADEALRMEGVASPRIAVAGLNPHAGEGGMFGREEIDEIVPAVEAARSRGLDVTGPHPPDTVFWHASRGRFDVVVVMYHDQGHIPAKLSGFDRSVNVTVGLPIIRASVDHGTAYDIAGTGQASEASLMAAARYARRAALAKHA
ncbi:MAG: 4-hydroxythreonine-4-phosphate dehydrogenase PdxA [Thioalkalivibrio sp.]|nr:4-hydroxythreonine-4-phosphate dehydrogenase PdxA [Thioalkalivibrio sp.]